MMTSDNLQEFVVNPWKMELVGAFFQSGIKKRENERMPPLVFEDCDVSSICFASDVNTSYDEDTWKVVLNSGLGREYRQVKRNQDLTDVSKVGNLICNEAKAHNLDIYDKPSVSGIVKSGDVCTSLKRDPDLNSNDTDLPVQTFSSVSSSRSSPSGSKSSTQGQSCLLTPTALASSAKLVAEAELVDSCKQVSVTSSKLPVNAFKRVMPVIENKKDSLVKEASSVTPVFSATLVSSSKPVSLTRLVSSAKPVSSGGQVSDRPVSSARPSSAKPVSSGRVVSARPVSVRPVSTGRPVSSVRPVYSGSQVSSAKLVSLTEPVKNAKSISTTAKTEVNASSRSSNLPISSTVPALKQVSLKEEVPSKSIVSMVGSSAEQVPASQIVSTVSSISSTRPTLIKKPSPKKSSLPPPIPVPPVTSSDQGSTCVSVILKSSRLEPKAARLSTVAKRQRQVEQLVSNYSLKFSHKSSPGVQVRLDYCFQKPGDARQFYKSVTSLVQSQPPPRLLSCILMAEADLGYQHQPVLTENELLAIQSPEYCRNLFRTSILIKVVQEEDVVVYHFKSVTDVNRFLYNKSSSVQTRSLGLLRRNVVPKRIIPDDEGNFRLFSAENKIDEKLSKKHKFRILDLRNEKDSLLDGNYLLFSSKLDMFKFLVSDDAANIEHLQFDGKKIKSFIKEVGKGRKGNELQENKASLFDKLGQNVEERKTNISSEMSACSMKSDQEVFEESLLFDRDDETEKTNHVNQAPDCPPVQKETKLMKSVYFDKDMLEMNGISLINNVQNLKKEEVGDMVNSALLMKEYEIRSLKKKLLIKEKIIQTEILEKTTANSSLKEALSQLDKINKLSLSVTGHRIKAE